MAKIMELTDLVVSRGVGLDVVGRLLMYTMPYFLVFTIPMATLLGVLIAFLRLSSDNEIVALKAAGVSLARLSAARWPPWPCSPGPVTAAPWPCGPCPGATTTSKTWSTRWPPSQAELALKEGAFIDTFPHLVIYIDKLPGGGVLKDVFIVDQRDPEEAAHHRGQAGQVLPGQGGQADPAGSTRAAFTR